MDKPYFVMLNHPNGGVLPMVKDDEGNMAFYETEEDAGLAAEDNPLGETFGYEIFCLGMGL